MIVSFLIAWFATKLNCHQGHVIAYLCEENRILKAKLKGKKIQLTDAERRRLAVLAHPIDRQRLKDVSTIATPDTLQRWYRRLVVQAPSGIPRDKRLGRPRVAAEIEQLAVRMAHENPRWGYRRIQGALSNLGHDIDNTTVRNILRRNHMAPAPIRGKAGMTGSQFVKLYLEVLQATGFFETLQSAAMHLWAVGTQPGRYLSVHGIQLISLICHGTLRVSTLVAQQWRILWSGYNTHLDVRHPFTLSRRQGVPDSVPHLHPLSSRPIVLQIDARLMKPERSPPGQSPADAALVVQGTALRRGVSPFMPAVGIVRSHGQLRSNVECRSTDNLGGQPVSGSGMTM